MDKFCDLDSCLKSEIRLASRLRVSVVSVTAAALKKASARVGAAAPVAALSPASVATATMPSVLTAPFANVSAATTCINGCGDEDEREYCQIQHHHRCNRTNSTDTSTTLLASPPTHLISFN
uniref:Uncharacterized protein n=1 Tax=Glossina pallidipes TaxID=7398 RepID=A0A1A9ZJU8_GLOPL